MKLSPRPLPTLDSTLLATPPLPTRIVDALESRGIALVPRATESESGFRERLDTELMALFRDTLDGEIFETLYLHARGRVFTWLRSLLVQQRSFLDPVELLQDTFVNVFRYSRRFRSDHSSSFRVWVRTIAANAMRRAQSGALQGSLQDLPEGQQEPIDAAPGPNRLAVDAEDGRALSVSWMLFLEHYARAYGELLPRDRLALDLVELQGLSYSQAGERLRVGPSNMKMIMFRSRQRIQVRMRRSMGIEEPQARAAG
jgi:RNA polymerase sigma factor (sigma-70 family)